MGALFSVEAEIAAHVIERVRAPLNAAKWAVRALLKRRTASATTPVIVAAERPQRVDKPRDLSATTGV